MTKRIILVSASVFCLLCLTFFGCAEYKGDPSYEEGDKTFLDPVPDTGTTPGAPLDWVSITGGTFTMGSELLNDMTAEVSDPETGKTYRDCYPTFANNETPERQVMIADFEILRTEVTVAQYRECVNAGVCQNLTRCGYSVEADDGFQRSFYNWAVDGDTRHNHPVNCIPWEYAKTYCEWADPNGRLPTEAEWEFAASNGGTNLYPWGCAIDADRTTASNFIGNDSQICGVEEPDGGVVADGYAQVAHVDFGYGCGTWLTAPVCSRPLGNTANGDLCDMTGNVWEWLQDHYYPNYSKSPDDGTAYEDLPVPQGDELLEWVPPNSDKDAFPWPLDNTDCDPEYVAPWDLPEDSEDYDAEEAAATPCRYCRTRRGSSYGSRKLANWEDIRIHNRSALWPEWVTSDTGFRCAR